MIVIADTTPLTISFSLTRQTSWRPCTAASSFPRPFSPNSNLRLPHQKSRKWISNRPGWLEVNRTALPADPSLAHLDAGERDAIILAQNLKADLLLMDDLGGRREAVRRNLKITGTLTVLYIAAGRGLIEDFPAILKQLPQTRFRAEQSGSWPETYPQTVSLR